MKCPHCGKTINAGKMLRSHVKNNVRSKEHYIRIQQLSAAARRAKSVYSSATKTAKSNNIRKK